ncbi:hypothetical protein CSW47_16350 [Thermus scotoductus]|uniref:Lipoprotein n=1 Tax=Thermus scotoductus TaxID=37636 RepID=A0A430QW03_THESC|nr:hypothetical protein [Thermus scotoductus]RTG99186.1 hypothetical protein CSW47_16350 [Thermus scotoductus]
MKRPLLWLLGSLLLTLAACSFTVTVDIPEQKFQAQALPNPQGQILYPKEATRFNPPPVAPKSVVLTGTLEASQTLNTTISFYVRLEDPSKTCQDLSLYGIPAYACPVGPADEKVGEAQFQGTQASLTLQGAKLTQGIAQGQFWLGLEAQSLPSSRVTFTLKNAKATVTVGL